MALERFLRDSRINTIFEGSSEIMRLFIAREALDPHLSVSGAALNSQLPWSQRLRSAAHAALFYLSWYPKQWLSWTKWPNVRGSKLNLQGSESAVLLKHLRFAARTSRKLARAMFHAMLRNGPKLERQQLLLGRFVDIATELFAITATCLRTERVLQSGGESTDRADLLHLADFFCRSSRLRIEEKFHRLHRNTDRASYRLAGQLLAQRHSHLETGIVPRKP